MDLSGWAPGPLRTTDSITRWSVDALAGLFDVPAPVTLPPLWHWLGFLDHPAQSELGADGHPAEGHFLPPMPDRRRMIAGGRVTFDASLPVGAPVLRESVVDGVVDKQGRSGAMVFVTVRSTFLVDGSAAVVESQDVVYRSQQAGAVRSLSRQPAELVVDPDFELEVVPDPAMLFRFSALTYNTHRIHYDQPYVTGVEGYPGLVVHGPLLALLLLEIPRRFLPDREVTAFSYRLSSPVFVGETVVVTGKLTGDRLELAGQVPGVAGSITGTAQLR